ncbi:MAG TPA: thioesterase [Haliangiales bacterium]|nr:thioesterase [Haliangiales bacterium]
MEPLPAFTVTMDVTDDDLASTLRGGLELPPVLATSRMIAWMELAAARCLEPLLRPGELSVGVSVDIKHVAATPGGASVRTSARYLGREGKLYAFEVWAEDPGGEIGRGRHARAIIDSERLMAGARRRG